MIKQPLKQYLEKLVAYNKKYTDASTRCTHIMTFTKYKLIKRTIIDFNETSILRRMSLQLHKRYLNNTTWIWK